MLAQYIPPKHGMVRFSNSTPHLEDQILVDICASDEENSAVTVSKIYKAVNDEVQKVATMPPSLLYRNSCSKV